MKRMTTKAYTITNLIVMSICFFVGTMHGAEESVVPMAVLTYLNTEPSLALAHKVSQLTADEQEQYLSRILDESYVTENKRSMPLLLNGLCEHEVSFEGKETRVSEVLDQCGPVGNWVNHPIARYWPQRGVDLVRQVLRTNRGAACVSQYVSDLEKGAVVLSQTERKEIESILDEAFNRLDDLGGGALWLYKRLCGVMPRATNMAPDTDMAPKSTEQLRIQLTHARNLSLQETRRREAEARAEEARSRLQELIDEDGEDLGEWEEGETGDETSCLEEDTSSVEDAE